MDNQNPKKSNKWLQLINIPIQMGAIVFAFAYLGNWLDEKYNKQVFQNILVIVGVALSFYNLNRQLKDINKSE